MIILSIENSDKLLSIAITNNKFLFYKEIYGNFVSSRYILKFIHELLIKSNLNYKNISIILIGLNIQRLTSIKMFFSVIQTLSIVYSIPLFKINSLTSMAYNIHNKKNIKYIFIKNQNLKFNLYFVHQNRFILITTNKYYKFNLFSFGIDYLFCITETFNLKINKNITKIILYSKSAYLDTFFRKKYNKNNYILPNSSCILYTENITYKPIIND